MPNLTQIQNILPPIAQKHGVETVGLFGARACWDVDLKTDYDFPNDA